jgi:prolipoprotein diacylglyceryltransferase
LLCIEPNALSVFFGVCFNLPFPSFFFGLCLTLIFTFRFFIEFLKENQVSFEDGMSLNMGQWLSIPFVIIGLAVIFNGKKLDQIGKSYTLKK